ncbi:MAG TPA: ABC-type transport auxiliary lipoprotein family protein [Paucimonas sp.]|nr:ABC-type transport auxiliary lipoprotein family protein [Paucimonas sp.]
MTLFLRLLVLAAVAGLLNACAIRAEQPTLYDLGPVRATAPATAPPAVGIAEVQAPLWLDSQFMYYRLAYVNRLQPRAYADSRWTMPPPALVGQHLKSRLAQAGGVVVAPGDDAGLPVLRIELDDFTQVFAEPGRSDAQVALRASLFKGRALLAQKTFLRSAPAPSPDATGGAAALAAASDAVINDVIAWLARQPVGK